jgi:hypothetical protein
MKVFLWSMIILLIAAVIHLTIWRIRLPKRQLKTMVIIFLATITVCLLILFGWGASFSMFGISSPNNYYEFLHILIFVLAATMFYVVLYPGLEADVPTLIIINNIAETGKKGMDEDSIYELVNDETLIFPRIRDLLQDKMVDLVDDTYFLTRKGTMITEMIIYSRNILNLKGKGG